jgi:hypothetical protein
LAGLVTACKHDDQQTTPACKVKAISWTEINPHLGYFAADRLPITEIPYLGKT